MSNSVAVEKHSLNEDLFNSPLDSEPDPHIAVAANIRDETLIEMMMNGDFKFDGTTTVNDSRDVEESSKSLPSSSSSSMFTSLEALESSTIHVNPDLDRQLDVVDNSNEEGFRTPTKELVVIVESSSESQQRKRRKRRLDQVVVEDRERPDWLPPDWQVEYRVREAGATAGLTDRYYYEPGSRRQFRSKKEVLCYLETGTRRKYKGKSNDKSISANTTPPSSSGLSEQYGSSPETKKRTGLNFDFANPPKKVTWLLNSLPEAPGSWTPIVGGEVIPEHTRQEWDGAFTHLIHGSGGIKFQSG